MSEKLKIKIPIIVEGRYDKSTLLSMLDATVITTEGFSIFNNKEKQALIRRLASDGIIVLTDSDSGGGQIRSFLSGILPKDKIFNLYIPQIEGKESRKEHKSKAGFLGVEGMKKDVILKLLSPFASDEKCVKSQKMITKVDFFEDKLTGYPASSERREALCLSLGLPRGMTPNALLSALNLLYGYDGYKSEIEKLFGDSECDDMSFGDG